MLKRHRTKYIPRDPVRTRLRQEEHESLTNDIMKREKHAPLQQPTSASCGERSARCQRLMNYIIRRCCVGIGSRCCCWWWVDWTPITLCSLRPPRVRQWCITQRWHGCYGDCGERQSVKNTQKGVSVWVEWQINQPINWIFWYFYQLTFSLYKSTDIHI